MIRFLKDRYFWYIALLAVFTGIFAYGASIAALYGLTTPQGWELAYYVAIHRFLFLMSVAVVAWRLGMKAGLAACIVLGSIIFSPFSGSLGEPEAWLEIGVIIVGILFSWLIGRRGEMGRLLGKTTEELRRQATKLSLEITEHKQAEELFKTVTNSSPVGIYIVQDRKFQLANPEFQKLTGYTEGELAGMDSLALVFPEDRDMVREKAIKMLKGEHSSPYQFRVVNKAGEIRWVMETATSIHYRGKRATLGNYMDVTERQQMEQQLMMTERLASVGELASGIAHELNNPLTSVIGFSQLLMENNTDDDIKEDLGLVCSEAQRAAGIVKNLLTFARKHSPVKQLSQINNVIEDVLRLRAYEQKVNNIEVNRRFASDLPETMVDYFQMQQVFLNIIINAEYFMTQARNKGRLTITTERFDNIVRISFADDGPGISKENLSRIFNPFFTTKEVGKGTGLGLSICHGIVATHGGSIYARSWLGEGATFIVELPINSS
jgi:PAS domain S-box-containing protein